MTLLVQYWGDKNAPIPADKGDTEKLFTINF